MVVSSVELLPIACSVELGRRRLIWKTVVMVGHALARRRMNGREV
jgi:hypothetical protein